MYGMCGFGSWVERKEEDMSDDCINVIQTTLSCSNQSRVTIKFLLTIDATESTLVSMGEVSSSCVTSVTFEGFCYEKVKETEQGKVR